MRKSGPEAVLYPTAFVVLLLILWECAIVFGDVPSFLLPHVHEVAVSLWKGITTGVLLEQTWATVSACAGGYLLGCGVAILVAGCLAESKWANRFFLWPITAFQSIPKVALAPIVFIWFGFGVESIVTLTALSCFFPVFVNTLVGLKSVEPSYIDLYRVHGGGRWPVFWQIKLPMASSHIFNGLQIAVVFALIATVVMEFFSSTRGLGYVIQDSANTLDLPISFASVVLLAAIGIAGTMSIRIIRRRALYWERDREASTAGTGH